MFILFEIFSRSVSLLWPPVHRVPARRDDGGSRDQHARPEEEPDPHGQAEQQGEQVGVGPRPRDGQRGREAGDAAAPPGWSPAGRGPKVKTERERDLTDRVVMFQCEPTDPARDGSPGAWGRQGHPPVSLPARDGRQEIETSTHQTETSERSRGGNVIASCIISSSG